MARPIGKAEELERRRRRAVSLIHAGEDRAAVARILGVHPKSLERWLRLDRQGPQGLAPRPLLGHPPRLDDARLRQLEALLLQGAKHHGWHNELWTAARVARLIESRFGEKFHPEHVRKILKGRLGWTSQKPRRKARERDDKEVSRWLGDEYPRILREAFARDAHLLFWDESGFFLTPTVRRTLAPRGKTPVLLAFDRRDKLSAISCISISPKAGRPGLHFELLDHNAKAGDVVAFLEQVRRQLRGALTVIWDGHGIHSKAKAVKAYLAAHPEVAAETFPGYVPDLNPDEGVWGWAKYGRLANLAAQDTTELWEQVGGELWELKHQPDLLKGFIRETGLIGLLRAG
jgi:transposase